MKTVREGVCKIVHYPLSLAASMNNYEIVTKAMPYLADHRVNPCEIQNVPRTAGSAEDQTSTSPAALSEIKPEDLTELISRERLKKTLLDSRGCFSDPFRPRSSVKGQDHKFSITCETDASKDVIKTKNRPDIYYGVHQTRFGRCLIGVTEKGICHLSFGLDEDVAPCLSVLKRRWKNADIRQDQKKVDSDLAYKIFGSGVRSSISLHLKGTAFQLRVWQALMKIPSGLLVTYSDLADYTGHPQAVRAVSNAVASNPVAFLIPCHRVIRKNGDFHNYRWGRERKAAMIIAERYG